MSGRYPLLSGVLLLFVPSSCFVSYLTIRHGNYAWINAVGVLIVPFAVFCWVFTTIRAIHLVGVKFWSIPSTYVALIGGIIAVAICMIVGLFSGYAESKGHHVKDITLYVAAAILYVGCVVWSYLYNWRTTRSPVLAVSLTILQTASAIFTTGVLAVLFDSKNNNKD